jgi:hypothetical protein
MVFSRQQPSGDLAELLRSHAALVVMDKEAAGSGGCSSTFHGRLGAGVTISIDAVPAVFETGLLSQHPICYNLFNLGRGVQGNSHATTTAAAHAAQSTKAVQEVYERFETAFDDLDSGLFDLDLDQHCYCCMQFFAGAGGSQVLNKGGHVYCRACSYQVHGVGTVASTPSSRPPRARTTAAAVAALAAAIEVAGQVGEAMNSPMHALLLSGMLLPFSAYVGSINLDSINHPFSTGFQDAPAAEPAANRGVEGVDAGKRAPLPRTPATARARDMGLLLVDCPFPAADGPKFA